MLQDLLHQLLVFFQSSYLENHSGEMKILEKEGFPIATIYRRQNNKMVKNMSVSHNRLPCLAAYIPLQPSRVACIGN